MKAAIKGFNGGLWAFRLVFAVVVAELLIVAGAVVGCFEEQMEIFSTFVRLGILIWSGGILTLNYVAIPNFPQKNIDPTFIASVFTGVLASFGIQTAKNKNAAAGGGGANISKKDMEMLIAKASETAPAQVVRIESAPVKIIPDGK